MKDKKKKNTLSLTNCPEIVHLWIIKAHLLAFPALFSLTWQHDGNRCLQINESKVTCNHPRFSSLDVFASTVTRKMRNSNLFQKITGTSYETGYLTCKSFRWFITATVLVCPRFQASTRACLHAYVQVCVRARVCVCMLTLAEACEWQPVSERDVIIWLMSVWVVTGGRVTSLAGSWHSADRKHYFLISHKRGNTLVTICNATVSTSFRGYSNMGDKNVCVCVGVCVCACECRTLLSPNLFLTGDMTLEQYSGDFLLLLFALFTRPQREDSC